MRSETSRSFGLRPVKRDCQGQGAAPVLFLNTRCSSSVKVLALRCQGPRERFGLLAGAKYACCQKTRARKNCNAAQGVTNTKSHHWAVKKINYPTPISNKAKTSTDFSLPLISKVTFEDIF